MCPAFSLILECWVAKYPFLQMLLHTDVQPFQSRRFHKLHQSELYTRPQNVTQTTLRPDTGIKTNKTSHQATNQITTTVSIKPHKNK